MNKWKRLSQQINMSFLDVFRAVLIILYNTVKRWKHRHHDFLSIRWISLFSYLILKTTFKNFAHTRTLTFTLILTQIVPQAELFKSSGTILKGMKENSSYSFGTITKVPEERSVSSAVTLSIRRSFYKCLPRTDWQKDIASCQWESKQRKRFRI
jgi:hypothetical protein